MTAVANLLALVGCVSTSPTRSPFESYSLVPATGARGTPAFCTGYARNTFASTFELHESAYSDAWAEQQAKVSAEAAYERCLTDRTN
jgi:hypothetical protein